MLAPHLLRFVVLMQAVLCVAVASARAQDIIWNQVGSPTAPAQPSSDFVSSWEAWDVEVADDFNLVGTVTRVRAIGAAGGFISPGAWVRFYDVAPDGKPGTLLHEFFFSSGDPNLLLNDWTIDVVLPTPLQVDSPLFISAQQLLNSGSSNPTTASFWRWNGTLNGYPNGQPSYIRNPAGGWGNVCTQWCSTNADRIFILYGSLSQPPPPPPPPVIDGLSDVIVPRNGRVKITGSNFTSSINNDAGWPSRKVLINGQPTARAAWTGTEIHAYILGDAPLGPATLQVQTEGGVSDPWPIDIGPAPPPPGGPGGRAAWRFMIDHFNAWHRAAVAPDGTVYCSDGAGSVYALEHDGDLKWIFNMTHGGINQGDQGPIVLDDQGMIYVAGDPLGPTCNIYSLNPDGTMRWVFTDSDTQGVIAGPAVGPDGNIYVVTDSGGLGLFSLTPDGQLRWSHSGNPLMYEHGQLGAEIVFGSLESGGDLERVYVAFDREMEFDMLYSFSLDGQQQWSVITGGNDDPFQGQIQPAVGPSGWIYLCDTGPEGPYGWRLKAFEPENGQLMWAAFTPGANALLNPDVGPDGTVYVARNLAHLHAFSPEGVEQWHLVTDNIYDEPMASPNGSLLVVGGVPDFGMPGFIEGVRAVDGARLWQVNLPFENNGNIVPASRPMFSADGQRAYVTASYLSSQPQDEYAYLYAINTAEILADITGDGVVNAADLLAVIHAWGPCAASCAADVNGDGVINVADLLLVLANWS